jgi:hypothetical protein
MIHMLTRRVCKIASASLSACDALAAILRTRSALALRQRAQNRATASARVETRARDFAYPTTFLHDTRGSALVEGAVLLPLLCVLVFGIYEFSWFFYQQHVASTGIRDAARYLSRVNDPCQANSRAWLAAQGFAKNLATTGSIAGGAPRIKGWTTAMVNLRCATVENPIGVDGLPGYRGPQAINIVTVSSRFADPSLGFFRFLGLTPPLISVSHSERATGPG